MESNTTCVFALILSKIDVTAIDIFIFACLAIIAFGLHVLNGKFGIIYQLFHKVHADSTHHGGDLVAKVLKAHGVKTVFALSGGHISPMLVAAEKEGIRVIDTRHEVTAVFAADAVARMSGAIGVALVTAGPGVTNTITAMKNAQMAESPVLLLGGATATILKGRGALQDIDQLSLFRSLCKYCVSVKTVRDIVPTLRKAIGIASSDTPGPVFVELPIDVLYPYELVQKELGSKGEAKTLLQKVSKWYLKMYLNNLFSGAWDETEFSPLSTSRPTATQEKVQKCAELVSQSKKPVMLIGSQATLPPTPVEELKHVVETLGIPCYLGGMARGLLGRNSSIQMRQHRREALQEADLVILAGSVCDFRLSYGRVLNRKSKIISINRDKVQLTKNSDMFWKPTEAIHADVGTFLSQVNDILPNYKCDSEWIQSLRIREDIKEAKNRKMAEDEPEQHLNPLKVLYMLDEVIKDDAIMVADGGDFVGSAAYILRPRGPLRWLDPGAFGTLGVGGGFALGAKLCRPDSEVWLIYGDGACGYSIAEFDTFTRHKLPVIAVVGNDAAWGQILREQVPMFGSNVACGLAYSSYNTVAEGYGAKGLLLDRKDKDRIKEVLLEAQSLYSQGNSVLVNALLGKSKFREGSISV